MRFALLIAVATFAAVLPLGAIALSVTARYRLPVVVRTSTPQHAGRTDQMIVTLWVRTGGVVVQRDRTYDIGSSNARPARMSAGMLKMSQSQWATHPSQAGELRFAVLGVGYRSGTLEGFHTVGGSIVPSGTPNGRTELLYLPWWLLIMLAVSPGLWLLHQTVVRPARRQARGLCRRCAYDLTGVGAERCPECGAQIPCRPRILRPDTDPP